jgi:ribonuclease HI
MPVIECDVGAARDALAAAGATIENGNTDHEHWRARRGEAVAVAYDHKVVIQGAEPRDIESVLRRDLFEEGGGRAHVYFDGAARGNPGPAAVGWVVVSGDGIVAEGGDRIGSTTNNRAEYEALIRGLEAARDLGFDEVDVRGDSELIVKQVRGEYDTNVPELRERRVTVRELLDGFDRWSLAHVPRETNERADRLANEALEGER